MQNLLYHIRRSGRAQRGSWTQTSPQNHLVYFSVNCESLEILYKIYSKIVFIINTFIILRLTFNEKIKKIKIWVYLSLGGEIVIVKKQNSYFCISLRFKFSWFQKVILFKWLKVSSVWGQIFSVLYYFINQYEFQNKIFYICFLPIKIKSLLDFSWI